MSEGTVLPEVSGEMELNQSLMLSIWFPGFTAYVWQWNSLYSFSKS